MLPGFRFLLAAIVLSISMLIFGLGAAALLRAAHEEFASVPSRRAPPETMFAQRSDGPVLAMLRAEPSAADEKATDPPMTDQTQDQTDIDLAPTEVEESVPGKVAALDMATPPENSPPFEAPVSETAPPEIPIQTETPSAQADDIPSRADEAMVAAIPEQTPAAPDQSAAAKADQASAPIDDGAGIADSRIATLGRPPVTVKTRTPAKTAPAVVRKSAQPKRVAKRRKVTPPARLARPAPQRPAPPFGGQENRGAKQWGWPGRQSDSSVFPAR
jgi:hypothetical protein